MKMRPIYPPSTTSITLSTLGALAAATAALAASVASGASATRNSYIHIRHLADSFLFLELTSSILFSSKRPPHRSMVEGEEGEEEEEDQEDDDEKTQT